MKQLIIFLLAFLGLSATAQTITGTWQVFPNYTTPQRMIETPEFVYVLAGTGLSGYDKTTGEVVTFNTGHRLNGNQVLNVWYDKDARCLLVAYKDFNIDLMFEDGRTLSIPDLRDAAINGNKDIRYAAFNNGKAYVAFASGMLVIDMEHGAITESCIWGKNITRIAVAGNKILLTEGWTEVIYVANIEGSHHNFEQSFTASKKSVLPTAGWLRTGANNIIAQKNAQLYRIEVNPDETDNSLAITRAKAIDGANNVEYINYGSLDYDNIQSTKNGVIAAGGGTVYYFDGEGNMTTQTIAAAKSHRVADWSGDGTSLWLGDASGYGLYSPAASAYTISPLKPTSTSASNVGVIAPVANGNIILSTVPYVQNSNAMSLAGNKTPHFDRIGTGDKITSLPANVSANTSMFAFDANPTKDNEFLASGRAGVRRLIENNGQFTTTVFSSSNSAISGIVLDNKFDSNGNLWVYCSASPKKLAYISADNWEKENPAKSDWKSYELPAFEDNFSTSIGIDETNNFVYVGGHGELIALDYKNNKSYLITLNSDEDGMAIQSWLYPSIVCDKKGWVWIASNSGVYVIRDSKQVTNPTFSVMRPKVPRNDGTNLADYLLDNIEVINIFVDDSDQKWISTAGSGLYRVSADGTAILDHFTTSNSDIPSDNVFASYADSNSNKVYVGTDQGLSIYHATSSPAAANFDDVYAYPNPVTPDYTGWITISGLMENSLVKIADASGRVFFEGKSDGGLLTWNGCDSSGNRVKSGVYFVFASRSDEGSSAACVTKIVVIN